MQPKAVSTNDEAKNTRATARGVPVHNSSSIIRTSREPESEAQKTTRVQQKREWGGMVREQLESVPLQSVVAPVSHVEEKTFPKSEAVKRPRSPDMHHHRKRGREDDTRPAKVSKALLVTYSNFQNVDTFMSCLFCRFMLYASHIMNQVVTY